MCVYIYIYEDHTQKYFGKNTRDYYICMFVKPLRMYHNLTNQ